MAELKQEWINTVTETLDRVYVSYSHFSVGTCLVMGSGKVYQGISIENASFGLTNCAGRITSSKAVSEGEETFMHLVITGHTPDPISPCGTCRQVMAEFCSSDMPVMLVGGNGVAKITTIHALPLYALTEKDL